VHLIAACVFFCVWGVLGCRYKEEALAVADDPDVKFDLALQLNKLEVWQASGLGRGEGGEGCWSGVGGGGGTAPSKACPRVAHPLQLGCWVVPGQVAFSIMSSIPDSDSTDAQAKWKQLSDLALATANLALAHDCSLKAGDLGGLLLLHSASGVCVCVCVHV
jgi:hypothetical protein